MPSFFRRSATSSSAPWLRVFSGTAFAVAVAWSPAALAQPPGPADAPLPVLVVDVPDDPALDATLVRRAIGAELHEDAVAPTDPRAAQAEGTLKVTVDPTTQMLVVSYLARTTPIERRIPLPADRAATARAVMLMAGNLARNEGEELAASLKPPKGPAPAAAALDTGDALALDHLGEALTETQIGVQHRKGAATAVMTLGIGSGAAGIALNTVGPSSSNPGTLVALGTLAYAGFDVLMAESFLLTPESVDDVSTLYAEERGRYPAAQVRSDVERAWTAVAQSERHRRRVTGWYALVIGGLGLAATGVVSAFLAARPSDFANPPLENATEIMSGFGVGSMFVATGVLLLTVPGYTQTALQRYNESMAPGGDNAPPPPPRAAFAPVILPTQGGAMAGVGGTF